MRAIVLVVLLVGCGHLPPPDEGATDGSTATTSSDASSDGGADASTAAKADAGVQQCIAAASAACRCESGQTCVIDCGDQHPVVCEPGSDCTVEGAQCQVSCSGPDTVCRVGDCLQCNCSESPGSACVK